MLRDADREEQLAAARLQQRNATVRPNTSFEPATITPVTNNGAATQASNTAAAITPVTNNGAATQASNTTAAVAPVTNNGAATQASNTAAAITPVTNNGAATQASNTTAAATPAANLVTNAVATNNPTKAVSAPQPQIANNSPVAKSQASPEELPTFVPAPKSLVSNSEASQVAAVNTNLKTNAQAVLTSLPKPIETALTSVSANTRSAQLILAPSDAVMKVGETRRFALEVKSNASLAMAVLALRFNPKVIGIKGISAGTSLAADSGSKEVVPGMTQSIDATGVCLISLSNLHSAASLKDSGLWLFIDVEALSAGDAGLVFDKDATQLMATDAGNIALDLSPVRATVKQ
jgi:hypothetical protein